jgi:hypothetical protein
LAFLIATFAQELAELQGGAFQPQFANLTPPATTAKAFLLRTTGTLPLSPSAYVGLRFRPPNWIAKSCDTPCSATSTVMSDDAPGTRLKSGMPASPFPRPAVGIRGQRHTDTRHPGPKSRRKPTDAQSLGSACSVMVEPISTICRLCCRSLAIRRMRELGTTATLAPLTRATRRVLVGQTCDR